MLSPPRTGSPLLQDHPVFASRDIEHARAQVARVFCTHDLRQVDAGQRLDCRMHRVGVGALSLNYLCYGADVDITPGLLNDFYLVQIPLSGRADIRYGRQQVHSDAATAVILSPHQGVAMRWQADCAQILLHIPRALMEQRAADDPEQPHASLDYQLALPQRSGPAAPWCQMVLDLARNIDANGAAWLRHPAATAALQDVLLRGLIGLQPHSQNAQQRGTAPAPALPRHVRRAQEFIEAQADQAITLVDIARAACVSERALQEGFQRHLGTTPHALLRDVRLDRVHAQLRAAANGGQPVALHDVAHRHGFFHLGRFSAYYKARFGETPSVTLQSNTAHGG